MNTNGRKEHPILFSGAMVRAILEGRKTQTRRVIKPQPIMECIESFGESWAWRNGKDWFSGVTVEQLTASYGLARYCPYGLQGDRLWVRESWKPIASGEMKAYGPDADGMIRYGIAYRADGQCKWDTRETRVSVIGGKPSGLIHLNANQHPWKPSIHMRRTASRLTLEITDVRVERLQQISAEDVMAEGIDIETNEQHRGDFEYAEHVSIGGVGIGCSAETYPFVTGWNALNAKRGYSWESNPWVWVIGFKRAGQEATHP